MMLHLRKGQLFHWSSEPLNQDSKYEYVKVLSSLLRCSLAISYLVKLLNCSSGETSVEAGENRF